MIKYILLFLALLGLPTLGQSTAALTINTGSGALLNTQPGTLNFHVPSGYTWTIDAGANIVNNGTATGFGSGGSGVTTFNTRNGAVTLLNTDVNALTGLTINTTGSSASLLNGSSGTLTTSGSGAIVLAGSGTLNINTGGTLTPAATNSAAYVQPGNNGSDFTSIPQVRANTGEPSYVGGAYNIVVLGDSIMSPGLTADIPYSFPGFFATMSFASQSTVYNLAEPGKTLATIYSNFSNGSTSITGCATTANSSTITFGSATGVANGDAVGGIGIPPNSVINYPGSGTTATLFQGIGQETISSAFVSSGPFTYTCTAGNYYLTASSSPTILPVAGMVLGVSTTDFAANTVFTHQSGSTWYASTPCLTTESSAQNGYVGYPNVATATGSSLTFLVAPPVSNGGYPPGLVFTGANSGSTWYSCLTPGQALGYNSTGTATIFTIYAGNNSIVQNVSSEFVGTANGTTTVTMTVGTGSAYLNQFTGYNFYANGALIGTCTSNTLPSGGTFTAVISTTVPAETIYSAFFIPSTNLSGMETTYGNLVSQALATGTAGTNTWVVCFTSFPAYESAINGNSQAYTQPVKTAFNSWIESTYGTGVTGVSVHDMASLPQFQPTSAAGIYPPTFNATYIGGPADSSDLPNATHPTPQGSLVMASFENRQDGLQFASANGNSALARGMVTPGMLPATVALLNNNPIFNAGLTIGTTATGSSQATTKPSLVIGANPGEVFGHPPIFINAQSGNVSTAIYSEYSRYISNGYYDNNNTILRASVAGQPVSLLQFQNGGMYIFGNSSTTLAAGQQISASSIASFFPSGATINEAMSVAGDVSVTNNGSGLRCYTQSVATNNANMLQGFYLLNNAAVTTVSLSSPTSGYENKIKNLTGATVTINTSGGASVLYVTGSATTTNSTTLANGAEAVFDSNGTYWFQQ